MNLFGFTFGRSKEEERKEETQVSIVPPPIDDGTVEVSAFGAYGTYVDLDGNVSNDVELINRYRDMSLQPEIDVAIDEIVNEAIDVSSEERPVEIELEELDFSEKVKDAVTREFNYILDLLDFNTYGYDLFRRWYIDGRSYHHVVIDQTKPNEGIKELRYVDPRKIRKVREVQKKRVTTGGKAAGGQSNVTDITRTMVQNEYFIYAEKGFGSKKAQSGSVRDPAGTSAGIKIAKDSIVYVTSGLSDTTGSQVLSYLHKAMKTINQLRTLEDAVVIYRIARAPERRLWYIDVGNLPKMKADQYVRDLMNKHKNRLVYDVGSGEIRDDRKLMTMLEDYWLPRRDGGKGTEVSTLPAGQNLGEMEDVLYFQKKLYSALHVPLNRLDKDNVFTLGRSAEITRDEVRFAKFVTRLRTRFSNLFLELLGKQLVLKQVMSIEEWEKVSNRVKFKYSKDNLYAELKEQQILTERMNTLNLMTPYIGRFYSHEWTARNVLRQSDEEMAEIRKQIEAERDDPIANPPPPMDPSMMGGDPSGGDPNAMPPGGDQQPPAAGAGPKPMTDNEAQAIYAQLKDKKGRTDEEEGLFRSAAMYLALNSTADKKPKGAKRASKIESFVGEQ